MNLTTKQYNLLKEEIKQHFMGCKTIQDWNQRRQELCDNLAASDEYAEETKVNLYLHNENRTITITVPLWVTFISNFVYSSVLITKFGLLPLEKEPKK